MFSFLKTLTVILITSISLSFAADVTLSIDGTSLNYESTADIYGFQFDHDDCASDASGGDAAANGFTISTSSTVVLAFSFSGSFICMNSVVFFGTYPSFYSKCCQFSLFYFNDLFYFHHHQPKYSTASSIPISGNIRGA